MEAYEDEELIVDSNVQTKSKGFMEQSKQAVVQTSLDDKYTDSVIKGSHIHNDETTPKRV